MALKYKLGDRVKIKSLDWYNENKNEYGNVDCNLYVFSSIMCQYCGTICTIKKVDNFGKRYKMTEDNCSFNWTDEMIEGLVEDEALKQYEVPTGSIKIWDLPNGYIFKDENGNVINATKIILEKKKKEYPKTYEECAKLLNTYCGSIGGYNWKLLSYFQKLLICRDAYWKIAGEEMGLRKPWEPDWAMYSGLKHCIIYSDNEIKWRCKSFVTEAKILAFPTKEMRDAFYENFKELIESCKELL